MNHARDRARWYRVNYQIRVPQVRLIAEDGSQLGIKTVEEAVQIAREQLRDVVEVVPTASPPICRVMDFRKFLFEQKKKEKELRKKQRLTQQKEIRLTPEISDHDYGFKKEHIEEFLKEGHRVKVCVFYRGRGIVHKDRGYKILEKLGQDLAAAGKIERPPRLEGRRLNVTFIPV